MNRPSRGVFRFFRQLKAALFALALTASLAGGLLGNAAFAQTLDPNPPLPLVIWQLPSTAGGANIVDVAVRPDGAIFYVTAGSASPAIPRAVGRFDPSTLQWTKWSLGTPTSLAGSNLGGLKVTDAGLAFARTHNAIQRVNTVTNVRTQWEWKTAISDIYPDIALDSSGKVWTKVSTGLQRLDPATGSVTRWPVGAPNSFQLEGVAHNPVNGRIYAFDPASPKSIVELNPASNAVRKWSVGSMGIGDLGELSVTANGDDVWAAVVSTSPKRVLRLRLSTNEITIFEVPGASAQTRAVAAGPVIGFTSQFPDRLGLVTPSGTGLVVTPTASSVTSTTLSVPSAVQTQPAATSGAGTIAFNGIVAPVQTGAVREASLPSGFANPMGIAQDPAAPGVFYAAIRGGTGIQIGKLSAAAPNQPPTANAGGPYTVDEGSSVTLTGSGTDLDGGPLSYEWDFNYLSTFTPDALGKDVTFSAAAIDGPATRTVALRVTDGGGMTAIHTAEVTIDNVAPSFDAGANAARVEGSVLQRITSFTDPGPDNWSVTVDYGEGAGFQSIFDSGKQYALNNLYEDNANLHEDNPGSPFTVYVRISDGAVITEDSFVVTITNTAPFYAPPAPGQTANQGEAAAISIGSFNDFGAKDDPWAVTVSWGDGSPDTEFSALTRFSLGTQSHTFDGAGSMTVTVTVTDKDGASDSGTFLVNVAASNTPPTANAGGPYTVDEGSSITLTGSATDLDGGPLSYEWDFNYLGAFTFDALGKDVTFSAAAIGPSLRTVALRVTDGSGMTAIHTAELSVNDVAPAISVSKTASAKYKDDSGRATIPEGGAAHQHGDQLVTFTFTVTNTSAASTDPVTVQSLGDSFLGPLGGSASCQVGTVLAHGASCSFSQATTMPVQNASSSHTNTFTASAKDDENNAASADTSATVTYFNATPQIRITKTPSPPSIPEGGVGNQTVAFTYTVTNTSSASTDPVTIAVLQDDVLGGLAGGATCTIGTLLLAGETCSFTLMMTMPVKNAGQTHESTFDAIVYDDENAAQWVTTFPTAKVTYTAAAPDIRVTKIANPTSVLEGGAPSQAVTYTYAVTNTSPAGASDPLSSVTLTDTDTTPTFAGGDSNSNGKLDASETWTYTATVNVPAKNAGQSHTNTATASGVDDEGSAATDTDTATVTYSGVAPSINVTKTPIVSSVSEGGVGDQSVTYTVTVTNTSPASTDPITVNGIIRDTDDWLAVFMAANGGSAVLAPGGSVTFSAVVQVSAKNAGISDTSTVTVNATDDEGAAASASDSATVTYSNVAPVAAVTSASIDENGVASLTLALTDPATTDPTCQVTIDWGDGSQGALTAACQSTSTLQHQYLDDDPSGTPSDVYSVNITVADDEGSGTPASGSVTVKNVNPLTDFGPGNSVYWGMPITLTGSYSDVGTLDTHVIQMTYGDGDGAYLTGANAYDSDTIYVTSTHVYDPDTIYYDSDTIYVAMLTVTDDDGGVGTDTEVVTVKRRPTTLAYNGDTAARFGLGYSLSATLSDNVNTGNQRVAGLTLSFTLNGATHTVTTDATGTGALTDPFPPLGPGSYPVTVSFAGNSDYQPSTASATLTVSNTAGAKITGTVNSGGNKGSFNVQSKDGNEVKGELQFHVNKTSYHAHTTTAIGVSADGTKGWFSGVLTDGRTFIAYVEKSSINNGADTFRLWIEGVEMANVQQAGGRGIQIHR